MKKNIINTLLLLSIIHLLTMIYYSITSEHAYMIANFPKSLFNIMLIYLPVFLTIATILIFLFDLIVYEEKNWFVLSITFFICLSEIIFTVGSLLYGGH